MSGLKEIELILIGGELHKYESLIHELDPDMALSVCVKYKQFDYIHFMLKNSLLSDKLIIKMKLFLNDPDVHSSIPDSVDLESMVCLYPHREYNEMIKYWIISRDIYGENGVLANMKKTHMEEMMICKNVELVETMIKCNAPGYFSNMAGSVVRSGCIEITQLETFTYAYKDLITAISGNNVEFVKLIVETVKPDIYVLIANMYRIDMNIVELIIKNIDMNNEPDKILNCISCIKPEVFRIMLDHGLDYDIVIGSIRRHPHLLAELEKSTHHDDVKIKDIYAVSICPELLAKYTNKTLSKYKSYYYVQYGSIPGYNSIFRIHSFINELDHCNKKSARS